MLFTFNFAMFLALLPRRFESVGFQEPWHYSQHKGKVEVTGQQVLSGVFMLLVIMLQWHSIRPLLSRESVYLSSVVGALRRLHQPSRKSSNRLDFGVKLNRITTISRFVMSQFQFCFSVPAFVTRILLVYQNVKKKKVQLTVNLHKSYTNV